MGAQLGQRGPIWIYISQFSVDTRSSEADDTARSYDVSEPPIHTDADPDCATPHNVTPFEERRLPVQVGRRKTGLAIELSRVTIASPSHHEDGSS